MREPWAPGFEDIIEASVARVMVLDTEDRLRAQAGETPLERVLSR